MARKLYSIWWIVLLRGAVEAGLMAPFWVEPLQSTPMLGLYVAAVVLGTGLLDVMMLLWMRGHTFQGILRLIAFSSIAFGGYLFVVQPTLLGKLLWFTGLWMAVRGFAGLWLGLSIVRHPYVRWTTIMAGLASVLSGMAAMLWLPPQMHVYLLLVAVYVAGSVVAHAVVAARMRRDRRRVLRSKAPVS